MDYDLHKIYVDWIYKVLTLNIEDLEHLYNKISKIPDADNKEIYINVDYLKEDMPESLKDHCLEVTGK